MNKITLAVGIPAYNEERNIGKLIQQVLQQKIDSRFSLESITVLCDGCNDRTEAVASKFLKKDDRLRILNDGKRLGLSKRLTQLYHSTKQEVLITFDADTALGSKNVITELALNFIEPSVGLVGGNDTPSQPRNAIQKIGAAWVEAWYEMRRNISGGDTVHNHKGCVSAGRTSFLKTVSIPSTIHSSDDFVYFSCKQKGLKFRFAEKAVVYYSIPDNVREYFIQSIRFLNIKKGIITHFGEQAAILYTIPKWNKVRGLIITFMRKPFYILAAIALQMYMRINRRKFIEDYTGVSWQVITSSKK